MAVALSIAISLSAAEILVRVVAPQDLIETHGPSPFRTDEVFGWRHAERIDTSVNTGEGFHRIVTDERGYRVSPGPAGGQADRAVLALGDSMLEGIQVGHDDTVTAVLARMLTTHCRRHIRVDNSGVWGWRPDQYLLEARGALQRERYDLGLVFVTVENDILTQRASSFPPQQIGLVRLRLPRSLDRSELVEALVEPFIGELNMRSHLFVLLKLRLREAVARLGLSPMAVAEVLHIRERDSQRWAVTADAIKEIGDEFARRGVPFIAVFVPASYQVDESTLSLYLTNSRVDPVLIDAAQPGSLLGSALTERAVQWVDLLYGFRARAADAKLYGQRDRHFLAGGHHAAAEIVAPHVADVVCR